MNAKKKLVDPTSTFIPDDKAKAEIDKIHPTSTQVLADSEIRRKAREAGAKGGRPKGCCCGSGKFCAIHPSGSTSIKKSQRPDIYQWKTEDVAILLDFPFDCMHGVFGPTHTHWDQSKKAAQASYDKISYALTRLIGFDPVYIVLALGITQYSASFAAATAMSVSMRKKEKITNGTDTPAKN